MDTESTETTRFRGIYLLSFRFLRSAFFIILVISLIGFITYTLAEYNITTNNLPNKFSIPVPETAWLKSAAKNSHRIESHIMNVFNQKTQPGKEYIGGVVGEMSNDLPLINIPTKSKETEGNTTNGSEDIIVYAIFDAGSSGTRLHLFKVKNNNVVQQKDGIDWSRSIKKSIVKCGKSSKDMFNLFSELFSEADQYIASEMAEVTDLRVKVLATGGTRDLAFIERSRILSMCKAAIAEAVLKTIFTKTSSYEARVISGNEEGRYLWLSMQYWASKALGKSFLDMSIQRAVADMGGSSLQLAYHTRDTTEIKKLSDANLRVKCNNSEAESQIIAVDTITGLQHQLVDHVVFSTSWASLGLMNFRNNGVKHLRNRCFPRTLKLNKIDYAFISDIPRRQFFGGGRDAQLCYSFLTEVLNGKLDFTNFLATEYNSQFQNSRSLYSYLLKYRPEFSKTRSLKLVYDVELNQSRILEKDNKVIVKSDNSTFLSKENGNNDASELKNYIEALAQDESISKVKQSKSTKTNANKFLKKKGNKKTVTNKKPEHSNSDKSKNVDNKDTNIIEEVDGVSKGLDNVNEDVANVNEDVANVNEDVASGENTNTNNENENKFLSAWKQDRSLFLVSNFVTILKEYSIITEEELAEGPVKLSLESIIKVRDQQCKPLFFKTEETFYPFGCFDLTYLLIILEKGFNMGWENVYALKYPTDDSITENSADISWPLGALLESLLPCPST